MFTLHVFAFAIVVRSAFSLIEAVVAWAWSSDTPDDFFQALAVTLLVYAFLALRRVYGDSAWLTGVKLLAITVIGTVVWVGSAAIIVAKMLGVDVS